MMNKNTETNDIYNIKIGEKIRKWRNLKGIKQNDFARLLNVSTSTLSNYENNKRAITTGQALIIAYHLKISLKHLVKDPAELLQQPEK
jgi:transcriptional regulator with XRE-family HTH domain